MAQLYSNENFPLPAVEELGRLGHDVLTIQETGQANQSLPDKAVLAFAYAEGRILLTFNRKHFIQLHRTRPITTIVSGVSRTKVASRKSWIVPCKCNAHYSQCVHQR